MHPEKNHLWTQLYTSMLTEIERMPLFHKKNVTEYATFFSLSSFFPSAYMISWDFSRVNGSTVGFSWENKTLCDQL